MKFLIAGLGSIGRRHFRNLIALGDLKVNLLPDLSYPTLTVRTEYTGAAPAEIETLISEPVEEAVGEWQRVHVGAHQAGLHSCLLKPVPG